LFRMQILVVQGNPPDARSLIALHQKGKPSITHQAHHFPAAAFIFKETAM
jgi:hypothetical protein